MSERKLSLEAMQAAISGDVLIDTQPMELLFTDMDDSIQALGHANRQLVAANARFLSKEEVDAWATECELDAGADLASRAVKRAAKSTFTQYRDHLSYTTTLARYHAAQKSFLDPVTHADIHEDVDQKKREYTEIFEQSADPFARKKAEVWVTVFNAQERSLQEEVTIETRINEYLDLEPSNIFNLIHYIEEGDYDKAEYRPLLEFLAKNNFDPTESQQLQLRLEVLKEEPELLKSPFARALDMAVTSDDTEGEAARALFEDSPEVIEWLRFMCDYVNADEQRREPVRPSDLLLDIPVGEWPSSVSTLFKNYANLYIVAYQNKVTNILTPYRRDVLFGVVESDMESISARLNSRGGKQQSKQRGGRVQETNRTSKKGRNEKITSQEELASTVVDRIGRCPKTPAGFIVEDIAAIDIKEEAGVKRHLTDTAALTALESVSSARKYIEAHSSDPDFQLDILRMMQSVLEEPRGNGAAKMPDMKINVITDPAQSAYCKDIPVWRLNPNDRSDLTIGNTARDTRIYYTITTDKKTGEQTLALLHVGHKSKTNQIAGYWKKV